MGVRVLVCVWVQVCVVHVHVRVRVHVSVSVGCAHSCACACACVCGCTCCKYLFVTLVPNTILIGGQGKFHNIEDVRFLFNNSDQLMSEAGLPVRVCHLATDFAEVSATIYAHRVHSTVDIVRCGTFVCSYEMYKQ